MRASPRFPYAGTGRRTGGRSPQCQDFDFTELLAEAEARLDDQGVPEHFGEELVLAEGEEYTGRSRGEDLDRAFDPPRIVYLLADLDGTRRFLRSRTMLERQMREAEPAVGDYLAGRGRRPRRGSPGG